MFPFCFPFPSLLQPLCTLFSPSVPIDPLTPSPFTLLAFNPILFPIFIPFIVFLISHSLQHPHHYALSNPLQPLSIYPHLPLTPFLLSLSCPSPPASPLNTQHQKHVHKYPTLTHTQKYSFIEQSSHARLAWQVGCCFASHPTDEFSLF